MITKTLLSAVIAGAVLLGCASEPIRPTTRATCRDVHCNIKVFVTNGKVSVDIDELEIKGNKNVHIHWHLPPNYEFDTTKSDGVILKRGDGDGQFYDQHASDDERGQTASGKKSGKSFHWRDKNTVLKRYEYKIFFHDRSGNPYSLDPTIMNAG